MDYAILRTGSRQYRVRPGDVIDVDTLPVEEGSSLELTDVLAVSRDGEVMIGDPLVPNASVIAQVRAHGRDTKIIVFKYKRKVRYRRKKGHRQQYTRLAITGIYLGGEEVAVLSEPVQETPVLEELPQEELSDEPVEETQDEPRDEVEDTPSLESVEETADELPAEVVDEPTEGEGSEETQDEPRDEVEDTPSLESVEEVTDEPTAEAADKPKPKRRRRAQPKGEG